ncbi:glycosyltransferase family 8 protein [Methylobacterium tardum]|uniref:glycosyltransferase family 8 protein n=1 Tax=Methylobacterium tardum TaxID=374432 RepID=UPI001EE14123|nr:glycosyltransferase [Methylobacterium tardum]URD37871.1 hypothetical protein M6G65_04905 [Methylobacterium tardum]
MKAAKNSAFCYVTDISYLAPTLISISSLRKKLSTFLPVTLVLTLKENESVSDLEEVFNQLSIHVIRIDAKDVEGISKVWAPGHVSRAALGRLLLHDILPTDIERIVYLDGDTVVLNDLLELALAPMSSGTVGMVEDAISFFRNDKSDNGRSTREHLSRIGLKPDDPYGNSGVMVANREDWKSLSLDALEYLQHSSECCPPYHDQSAINAVIGRRRACLSTRWNCQSRFAQWDDTALSKASLLHFTGAKKPWMGSVYPWQPIFAEINELRDGLNIPSLPLKTMSADELISYNSQFIRPASILRKYFDLRLRRRPQLISKYDNTCII